MLYLQKSFHAINMRINKLSFKDNVLNWELSETTFDKFTLLVGASGVGKTKILNAIDTIKKVAFGYINKRIEWSITFLIGENLYVWSGKIDNLEIQEERILLNGKSILERNKNETIYLGQPTVKLTLTTSIVPILKEEELIKPIYDSFRKIYLDDLSPLKKQNLPGAFFVKDNSYKLFSLEDIRNSELDIKDKLYLLFEFHKDVFEDLKLTYIDIFPLVNDIQIIAKDGDYVDENHVSLHIQIKEKGIDKWINENDISSGMYRVLIHIAEMYLCADGSVFMIDEFENSLGINCIDELTNEILLSQRDIQFIITSHHPYIINNIDFLYWKLVTRKGSVVKTTPITDYIHGESSHDKFMQLIQLSQYQTGED